MKDEISAPEELEVWGVGMGAWADQKQHPGSAELRTGQEARSGRGRGGDESYKSLGAVRVVQQAAGACPRLARESGWAPGTRTASSGAAGSKNPEEELPTAPC